jgi:type IV pilus assembly protein PilM
MITIKHELAGLDIGSSAVKIAKLKRRGSQYIVTAVAYAPIRRSNANPQQLMNRTVSAIRRCIYTTKTRNVACAISGSGILVRQFDFPQMKSKHIAEAVRMEATQVCPFNIEDSATDYQLLSSNGDRSIARLKVGNKKENMHGILAAAMNNAVKDKKQLAEAAGARCMVMDVDGLAILNCLTACWKTVKKNTVLVMDVGSSYTNVAILSKEGIPFIRDIPYAADHIVNKICIERGLATDVVAKILSGSTKEEGPSFDTIESSLKNACTELANEITDTIRYYTTNASEETVDKIYLCGGFSKATGFAEMMGDLLSAPLVLWNPLTRLRQSSKIREMNLEKTGPSFAVAIGLAMRSG